MKTQKTIIITGSSDGIGAAAARQLAAKGERVVLIGRSESKTKAVASDLGADYYMADFADLQQVRELAQKLTTAYPHIDVLANNAGGIMGNREVTKDGFEKTFQVNHLAQFLLTKLLMPTLIASKASVIQTASIAAKRFSNLDINDLQNESNYSPEKAYGDAKLANILFTRELHNRFHAQGVSTVAFHPGIVATNFANDTTHFMRYIYHAPIIKNLFTISSDKAAAHLTWLIEGTPGETWQSGEYYEKDIVAKSSDQADDRALAKQLWDVSEQYLA